MSAIDAVIPSRPREVGGQPVGRVLPVAGHRAVGPFVFLDHMGPVTLAPGHGMDVRPHPHIGLATVTYLFEGAVVHRDSIGSVATIVPGDIDWMSAGRGIVHSERTPDAERARGGTMHGLQLWVALPREHEDSEPTFEQHRAATLPSVGVEGVTVRVLAGSAYGVTSPVKTVWPLFYVDVALRAGEALPLPTEHPARAVFVVWGGVAVDGEAVAEHSMAVVTPAAQRVTATADSRIVMLGGSPLAERRLMDWNFVSSTRERIDRAREDWGAGRFPRIPTDDGELEPLPVYPPKHEPA
jgi:redox-sensitive bicupin YhaK (pirin superfamily)